MKTIRKIFVGFLCATVMTTAAFGQGTGNASQTNFTWIAAGANLDLGTAANWTPAGVPVPARNNSSSDYGDIMTFDGQTAGPISATSNGGAQTGSSVGGTTAGIYVHLTANQTNSVTFHTTVANTASSGIRFNSVTIDAGAGSFYFGKGSTTNALDTIWGTSNPSTQTLTNNSANPAYILSDMRWRYGAGGAHTIFFGGTGDWYITNDLANIGGAATVIAKAGPGTMYWTAGHNSFFGTVTAISTPLTISGGTLVLKSAGLIPASTTINNTNGLLVFDVVGGAQTISNPIHGTGNLQVNNGTLTLSGLNDYTGITTVSNGALFINRTSVSPVVVVGGTLGGNGVVSAPVTVFAGATLSPGASAGTIGTFTNNGGMNLGGNVAIDVNKSFAQSNDFVVVVGGLTNSGTGSIIVSNLGPALAVGDKFTLFNKPLANGAAMSITGAGTNWINNLAVDGSISVGPVIPPMLNFTNLGGSLQLAWSGSFKLQSQTNILNAGLGTNWSDYPDGGTSPVTVPMVTTNESVFLRLISTP